MKMKKLLAAALAATMMLSSMVTSMVASAETTNAVVVDIVDIKAGDEVFTANFDIDFDPAVDGPHLMFDVDAEGATITDIKSNTDGITVEAKDGGANLAEGMFITEGAGGKEFDDMSLTATFTLAEAAAEGDTITVNVAVTDNADWNENAIVIAAGTDSFTLEVAAPECDHANATYVDNKDGTHTATCPDCSDAQTVAHSYTEAVCVCGAKYIDKGIDSGYLSSGLGETPEFNFMFDSADFAAYDSYELVATRVTNTDKFDFKTITEVVTNCITEYAPYIIYVYDTVELYSLTVPVTFQVVCYKDGKVAAYSEEYTSTLKDVYVQQYNSTSDVKLKRVITDILNVGAESQKFVTLGLETSDYATKLPLANKDWDQTYATTELGAMSTYNNVVNGNDAQIYMSAAIDASLYPCFLISNFDANKKASYDLKVSFYDVINKKTVNKTFNLATQNPSEIQDYGSMLIPCFKDVTMYSTNAEITGTFYKDGVEIGTVSYCLDAFIQESIDAKAATATLLTHVAYLSQSFRAFNGL